MPLPSSHAQVLPTKTVLRISLVYSNYFQNNMALIIPHTVKSSRPVGTGQVVHDFSGFAPRFWRGSRPAQDHAQFMAAQSIICQYHIVGMCMV